MSLTRLSSLHLTSANASCDSALAVYEGIGTCLGKQTVI